jgi:hypothetical protein
MAVYSAGVLPLIAAPVINEFRLSPKDGGNRMQIRLPFAELEAYIANIVDF